PFDVINPKTNGGKSMLVLTRQKTCKAPATMLVPIGCKAKSLAIHHVAAWCSRTASVKVTIHYASGVKVVTTLGGGHSMGDWWQASPGLAMARRAWRGANPSCGSIGTMYTPIVSPQPNMKIDALEFHVPKEQTQMVYGLIGITALQ
ncbi:MAG: hypothetical protein GY844_06700, partial [Bradyrhizobium sp.]|nr:hypothetical protein [Bradyrhizobium sp.]